MAIAINGSGTITGISTGALNDDAIAIADLSATGTASSSTFLRGDNTWAGAGKIKNVWTFTDSTEASTNAGDYETMVSTTNIMPSSGTKNLVMISCPYQTKGHSSYNESYGAMCLFRDTTKLQAELVGVKDPNHNAVKRSLGVWTCIILDTHGADGSTNIQYHIKAHTCTSNWTMYIPNDEYYGDFDSSEDLAVARITVMELDL